jgi:hypothetical protein
MWPLVLTVTGLCAAVAVVGVALYVGRTAPPARVAALTPLPKAAPAVTAPVVAASPPMGKTTPVAKPAPPAFDIVRITPDGNAVIAGHAASGAEVTILDGGVAIGHVTADAGGDWTWLPDTPLPPGQRSLTLAERLPDGATLSGEGPILATIPPAATLASAAPPAAAGTQRVATAAEASGTHLVAPGDSLWRLARQSYGAGQRYLVIYDANRAKIVDPGRIYPGQSFTVPAQPAAPAR